MMKNEKMIFCHCIKECSSEKLAGNHLYSGRALGLTEQDDLIQLHPQLQSEWGHIVNHYARSGLQHTRKVIWDVSPTLFKKYPEHKLSSFFFDLNSKAVKSTRAKNRFIRLAKALGLDIPKTSCFKDNSSALRGVDAFQFPCYLKASNSAAGIGIYRCEDKKAFLWALSQFENDVPLQVQEEVKTSIFLNLQYEVTHKGLQHLATTEQLLNGFVHAGNRFPANHEPWESVEPMAQWMYDKGMQGVFAFDVGVEDDGDTLRYVPIECNPRFNGSSYPTLIARKLGLKHWNCEFLETAHRSLASLNLAGIEFDNETKSGVIIVNWGTVLIGKIAVLIAGSPQKQAEIKAELNKRL